MPDRRSYRRRYALLLSVFCLVAVTGTLRGRTAQALAASGPLVPTGSAHGGGTVTTTSGPPVSVSVTLQGAQPNATYTVYTCPVLVTGGFGCAGKQLPLTAIVVAPAAIAPVMVSLYPQGTLSTDVTGSGSALLGLPALLLPDTPASLYNVVQLVNQADMNDAYTGLNLPTPAQPIAGVAPLSVPSVALALDTPVYVLVPFPGYAFPVAITSLSGAPLLPLVTVPLDVLASYPGGYSLTTGLCPSGRPPVVQPDLGGVLHFLC